MILLQDYFKTKINYFVLYICCFLCEPEIENKYNTDIINQIIEMTQIVIYHNFFKLIFEMLKSIKSNVIFYCDKKNCLLLMLIKLMSLL